MPRSRNNGLNIDWDGRGKVDIIFDPDGPSLHDPPRPTAAEPHIVQIEMVEWDATTGEGEWAYYQYPNEVREFDDWHTFELYCRKMLVHSLGPLLLDHALNYMMNTKVLNINLETKELYNPFLAVLDADEKNSYYLDF